MSSPSSVVPDSFFAQQESTTSGVPEVPACPICSRSIAKYHKCKTLYGVKVCRKCRNSLANRRQAGYLIDGVLLLVLTTGVNMALAFMIAPGDLAILLTILLNWGLLNLIFLSKDGFAGQSPGKALLGVQVIDVTSREPIGLGQSIKRNLPLLLPYIGVVVIIITMMKGQRWADRWANTMVNRKKHRNCVSYAPPGPYCRSCGYDLTGNVSGRCPECGVDIPSHWLIGAEPAGSNLGS